MLQPSDRLLLLRLNYEWRNLVNLIKFQGRRIWKNVYRIIIDELEEYLGPAEVTISSEYMVFDNCIRQLGSLDLLLRYYHLVHNFRQIFHLCCFLPLSTIRKAMRRAPRHVKGKIAYKLDKANHIAFGRDLETDDSNHEFQTFELNIDNISLIDDLIDMYPEESPILQEVIAYIEALYIFEIMYPVGEYPDSESDTSDESYQSEDDFSKYTD